MATPAELTVLRQYTNGLALGVRTAMAKGIAAAMADLPEVMQNFGEALGRQKIPADLLRTTNLRIAEQAQEAMALAVENRSITRRYRTGERLAGGVLAEGLRSPAMVSRTTDNLISFLNPEILANTAAHWARVNYGVAGKVSTPGYTAREYTVTVNGQVVMTLADRRGPVPGGVYLPRAWEYIKKKKGKKRVVPPPEERVFRVVFAWKPDPGARRDPRVGARAQHFVDAGLGVVADQLGPEYDRMWRGYASTLAGQVRLERANIRATVDMRLQGTSWNYAARARR